MEQVKKRADVAVFVDFENIYVSVREKFDAQPNFELIMDRCEDYGRIVIARAYADWYRYPRVTSALFANGVEPMYVPTYYYDREAGRTGRPIKNSVDIHLCIDAMRTLYTQSHIDKFVLVTGDRDFIPLVNAIRQHGKEVIIIGIGGAASAHLAQSSDEFLFYEQIADLKSPQQRQEQRQERPERRERERDRDKGERADGNGKVESRRDKAEKVDRTPEAPEAPEAPATPERNVYDTLVDAINLARQRGFVSNLGSLKVLMRELDSSFHESKVKDRSGKPFTKFKDFVKEAERLGRVQIFTNGTVTEVFLPGEDPLKVSQFAEDLASDQAERELERELEQQQDQVAARAEAEAQRAQPAAEAAEAAQVVAAESPTLAAGEMTQDESEQVQQVTFSDRDWEIFRGAMLQFSDPVRFADIFTMLRGLRNQEVIDLTNHELKELVKQAINRGMLQRTGRGARAYYRLSSQYRVAPGEAHEQRESPAAAPEEPLATEQPAPLVESAAGVVSEDGLAPSRRRRVRAYDIVSPEAAVEQASAAPELTELVAEQLAAQTVDAPPAKPRRNRRRKSSAAAREQPQAVEEAASAPVAEAPEAPAAAEEALDATVTQTAEAAEAKPNGTKKRRSRRKKAAPNEETQAEASDHS